METVLKSNLARTAADVLISAGGQRLWSCDLTTGPRLFPQEQVVLLKYDRGQWFGQGAEVTWGLGAPRFKALSLREEGHLLLGSIFLPVFILFSRKLETRDRKYKWNLLLRYGGQTEEKFGK